MLLGEYGEVIEADLQRYYGVDLGDLWRGRMSMRRCMVLIAGLPPGAGLHRATGGDRAWSDTTRAVMEGLWRIECTLVSALGGSSLPDRPKPPEYGWQEAERARVRRTEERIARHKARTQRNTE